MVAAEAEINDQQWPKHSADHAELQGAWYRFRGDLLISKQARGSRMWREIYVLPKPLVCSFFLTRDLQHPRTFSKPKCATPFSFPLRFSEKGAAL
jgi:hypothetical protein